jgi:hypothetical protein
MNADVNRNDTRRQVMRRLSNPMDFQWHAHGIGMLRTYLDEDRTVRLNLWHKGFLNPGISTMHTHPRPFTSTVYAGMMTNITYARRAFGGVEYREGIIQCGDAFNGIESTHTVYLEEIDRRVLYTGDTYSQPTEVIHDTDFINGTVTVMTWDRAESDKHASVFWPPLVGWGDATRNFTREECLVACAIAKSRMELGQ